MSAVDTDLWAREPKVMIVLSFPELQRWQPPLHHLQTRLSVAEEDLLQHFHKLQPPVEKQFVVRLFLFRSKVCCVFYQLLGACTHKKLAKILSSVVFASFFSFCFQKKKNSAKNKRNEWGRVFNVWESNFKCWSTNLCESSCVIGNGPFKDYFTHLD